MKPRNPLDQVGGDFPSNVSLNSSDFLTGEELQGIPNGTEVSAMDADSSIPDVHTLESVPNTHRRAEIEQQVDQKFNKIDTLEDKIQRDVQDAQQRKFESVPKSPKDILKHLIAKGEYTENVELFGHTWKIRALDQSDTLLAMDEIKDTIETQSGRIMGLMFGIMIYAIEAVDGISIYEWFEDIKLSDFRNDRMEYHIAVRKALRRYLEALPPAIIEAFYEKYLALEEKRNVGIEELKNS